MNETVFEDGDRLTLSLTERGLVVHINGPSDEGVVLDTEAARRMAKSVLRALGSEPDESTYQVVYTHEYTDENGEIVPCFELGPGSDESYVFEALTLEDVAHRIRVVGQAVADLHRERLEKGAKDGAEGARAWISVFRMPADERVWKGFWDEFDGHIGD